MIGWRMLDARFSILDALQDIRKSEEQGAGEQENRTSGLFEWVNDWMADARCSMLDARYSMLDARYSMLDARCSILDARYSILDTRYSMLDTRCSMPDT